MSRPASASVRASLLDDEASPLWVTLERLALVLVAGIVIARAMMMETIRDPNPVVPGQIAAPYGPGAVTILVLGLLAILPAMVVLLRRALDPDYRLTGSSPSLLLVGLGLLAALSSLWAGDRFGAFVAAAQLISAAVILWTTAQLVRDWARFRLGIAVAMGLLFIFIVQGIGYRALELPELRHRWENDVDGFRTQALRERGWKEDDYPARKFAQKVMGGEMIGNMASPNTLAATTVLLAIVAMGLLAHRLAEREHILAVAPVIGLVGAAWLIYYTYSNTAYLTPLLGAALLAIIGRYHAWIARRRRIVFIAGCCAVGLGTIALIGHGLYHGSLPHVSLTFRWRYWLAAASMFADHPFFGVGYANFGNEYLAYRLPAAAEEIRDPHNLLVRFATELGLVGALLAVAWLGMLLWRFSRPKLPSATPATEGTATMVTIALALLAGFLLNLIASIDYSQSGDFILLEVFKRSLYLGLLVLGAAVVILRLLPTRGVDLQPARWLVWSTIVAIAMFLVHNLIDFAFFEAGPMHVFALLAGGVIGIRSRSGEAPGRGSRAGWLGAVAGVGVLWLAAAVTLVGPVMLAEDQARSGDALLRAGNIQAAAQRYAAAFDSVPWNADYAYRAAGALLQAGAPPEQVRAALGQAIEAEPTDALYRLTRARYALQLDPPQLEQALVDFDAAIQLNPQEIGLRWEYAGLLAQAGRRADAIAQAEAALTINAAYAADESEKLTTDREAEIQAFIERNRDRAAP